eukprot:1139847-Pelagomonas_calceolata.AAC.13
MQKRGNFRPYITFSGEKAGPRRCQRRGKEEGVCESERGKDGRGDIHKRKHLQIVRCFKPSQPLAMAKNC